MGAMSMGKYIDSLDVEGRDRLIAAPEFSNGKWWDGSCGCLVGTAEDLGSKPEYGREWDRVVIGHTMGTFVGRTVVGLECGGRTMNWKVATAAFRYPAAVHRFGKARVVRAIKARAARLNASNPEAIAALIAPSEATPSAQQQYTNLGDPR